MNYARISGCGGQVTPQDQKTACLDCGTPIAPRRGPGRPRKRCTECSPSRVKPPDYVPPLRRTTCSECGATLTGRHRVICGRQSCRDRRLKRLHPEAYAERERQKVERRREARRAKRETES